MMQYLCVSIDAKLGVNSAATVHTLELASAIAKKGKIEPKLIISGEKHCINNVNNLEVITISSHYTGRSKLKRLLSLIDKNIQFYRQGAKRAKNAEFIYERHNIASFVGIFLSRRYRLPLYFEVNSLTTEEAIGNIGSFKTLLNKLARNVTMWHLNSANKLFVQTEELKQLLKQLYGVNNVFVVHNGARLPRKRKIPEKQNRKILNCLYVGAIDNYHNVESLVQAFVKLGSIATLTLVGEGDSLLSMRQKYNYKHINFTGQIPHDKIGNYINKADIGLAQYNLNSPHFKKFGFYFCPIKIMEYSAHSIPSIYVGRANSYIKEYLAYGAGFVLPSVTDIAKTLRVLLGDHDTAMKEMRNNAFLYAKDHSWDKAAELTLLHIEN